VKKPSLSKLSANPIEGWKKTIESTFTEAVDWVEFTSLPMKDAFPHQTLVIVEASCQSPPAFKERVERLIGGFNTPQTIKANIITVADGLVYPGLTYSGKVSGGLDVEIPHGMFNMIVRVSDRDVMLGQVVS